jgi:hypothetical protein
MDRDQPKACSNHTQNDTHHDQKTNRLSAGDPHHNLGNPKCQQAGQDNCWVLLGLQCLVWAHEKTKLSQSITNDFYLTGGCTPDSLNIPVRCDSRWKRLVRAGWINLSLALLSSGFSVLPQRLHIPFGQGLQSRCPQRAHFLSQDTQFRTHQVTQGVFGYDFWVGAALLGEAIPIAQRYWISKSRMIRILGP